MTQTPSTIGSGGSNSTNSGHAALIANRLRQRPGHTYASPDNRLPWYALEHAVASDFGHIHAAHDLNKLPITTKRRIIGPVVIRVKRALRRLLAPLPESQSAWNGANARVITVLLRQLAAQEQAIESLERQISELYSEQGR